MIGGTCGIFIEPWCDALARAVALFVARDDGARCAFGLEHAHLGNARVVIGTLGVIVAILGAQTVTTEFTCLARIDDEFAIFVARRADIAIAFGDKLPGIALGASIFKTDVAIGGTDGGLEGAVSVALRDDGVLAFFGTPASRKGRITGEAFVAGTHRMIAGTWRQGDDGLAFAVVEAFEECV